MVRPASDQPGAVLTVLRAGPQRRLAHSSIRFTWAASRPNRKSTYDRTDQESCGKLRDMSPLWGNGPGRH